MNKSMEKSRIEYVRSDFFNERIGELEGIGETVIQIEHVPGGIPGFLIEHAPEKVFAAQGTIAGKLKTAEREIRNLKKTVGKMGTEAADLRKRATQREKGAQARQMYEFMLLSAINELGRILGGLPCEFRPLLKWKRYGDFAAARREYCEVSGTPEKSLLPDPESEQ